MQPFIGSDFLLQSETAKTLFFEHANRMPIVDYHCHIEPREIYKDKQFADLCEAWLGADHYKWRLMRACGVPEACITGDASPWEKFRAFAEVLPRAIGNPVYHWAHLELRRYFDCHLPLNPQTAREIWAHCNAKLQNDPNLRVRGIIRRSNVTALVTTDDPVSDLSWHQKLRDDPSFETKVLPAWRPDAVLNIAAGDFGAYFRQLSAAANVEISNFASLRQALNARMDHFASLGCRASDHGLQEIACIPASDAEIDEILRKRLAGASVSQREVQQYQYALLLYLGREYARRGWVMELHFGVLRNINTAMLETVGINTGFDVISPTSGMQGLHSYLDALCKDGLLPKTLLFSLNPTENAVINTIAGSFTQPGIYGKVQQGSAWWFNDNITGMTEQLTTFANMGVLANFVGMLTDSRSFLSYTRHEYFRRILCNLLGNWVENGEYPADLTFLGKMAEDISYNNAMAYFGY